MFLFFVNHQQSPASGWVTQQVAQQKSALHHWRHTRTLALTHSLCLLAGITASIHSSPPLIFSSCRLVTVWPPAPPPALVLCLVCCPVSLALQPISPARLSSQNQCLPSSVANTKHPKMAAADHSVLKTIFDHFQEWTKAEIKQRVPQKLPFSSLYFTLYSSSLLFLLILYTGFLEDKPPISCQTNHDFDLDETSFFNKICFFNGTFVLQNAFTSGKKRTFRL